MNELTIEQLENFKNTYDKYEGIEGDEFDKICNELIKYKLIEKRLECPFEIFLKALEEGIYYYNHRQNKMVFIDFVNLLFGGGWRLCVCNPKDNFERNLEFELCSYQKTWWLKSDIEK